MGQHVGDVWGKKLSANNRCNRRRKQNLSLFVVRISNWHPSALFLIVLSVAISWSTNMNLDRNIVLLSDYPSPHELSQSCPCTYIDLHNETIQSLPESLLDTIEVDVSAINCFCISPQIVTFMFSAANLLFIAVPLSLANGKLSWLYQVKCSRNTLNTIQT